MCLPVFLCVVNLKCSVLIFSEPFLESIPQIHILMCLIVSNNSFISGYVAFTIISSVLSGGFGIAKFMKTGPCKMVPSTTGFIDGFVSLGFPAVVLSVIATVLGKGLMLPVVVEGADGIIFANVVMWMGFNLLPQMVYVSKFQLNLFVYVINNPYLPMIQSGQPSF